MSPSSSLSEHALVEAMLEVERALAEANAAEGLIPSSAVAEIAAACDVSRYDVPVLWEAAESSGNPVVPLVRAMDAGPWVHLGATSQDILDSATMVAVKRALAAMPLASVLEACARLVRTHRSTVMAARTLGQQAVPTTFGLVAATWLHGMVGRLDVSCFVQFGGAAGTLAGSGGRGVAVATRLGALLGLAVPVLPWHTERSPMRAVAHELASTVVACGKVALDVTLLAQTEVGEVSEGAGGGSSAMPHKRNPVDSVLILAAARRVPGLLGPFYAPHELQRAVGGWQAEWEPLRELVRLTESTLTRTERLLTNLRVHPDRMLANLDPRTMAESVASRLAPSLGRAEAHALVARLAERSFREALLGDPSVREVLSVEDLDAALDPASWLGSADELIDRVLARYEEERPGG
jgi:3-carboxy-cis,cis-muconate cycloisomerase